MDDVMKVLCRALRKATPQTARRFLAAASLGVLAATKLLVRLETGGTLVLPMEPEGLDIFDELSEEVAEEYFDIVAAEACGAGTYNARLGTARFSRSERAMVFRWAAPMGMDEQVPEALHDLVGMAPIVEDVITGMLDVLFGPRSSSNEERVNAKIASFIGFTAAVKVVMAFWADDPLARAIETFADLESERRYRQLMGHSQPMAASRSVRRLPITG